MRNKKCGYILNPKHDLTYQPSTEAFVSTGDDPHFIVDLENQKLAAGWYWLSIAIKIIKGKLLAPKLYFDFGRGLNEEDTWNLPNVENNKIQALVKFPFDIIELRFDPSVMACCFQLHSFNLKPISKLTAFRIALKNYKNTYAPEKNYFSIFPNLVNDFVAAGTLEVKKRMRTSVTNDTTKRDQYKDWCDLYDTLTSAHLQIIAKISSNLPYQPLFSIIMPVYNAPVYFLRKAIESVQKQVYQNWQLCIADDASTNADIKKVLAEYSAKDKRVKVVFREVNGHISKASNSALELATGEYMV